jgi:outer membrane protein assembly factor BamB
MKTKLTLFVAVIAAILLGTGCASINISNNSYHPDAGKLVWKHQFDSDRDPYVWALDKAGYVYLGGYHLNGIMLDSDTGKFVSKSQGAYSVVIPDNGVLYSTRRGTVNALPAALNLPKSSGVEKIKWDLRIGSNNHAGTGYLSIDEDGTVYIGYMGGVWSIDGKIGKINWQLKPDELAGGTWGGPSVVAGGKNLYVADGSKVFAFDAKTKKMIWRVEIQDAPTSHPAIGDNGILYIGSKGKLVGLDLKTGEIKWQTRINATPSGVVTIGKDGTVYFGSRNGFYAFDGKTGAWKWDQPLAKGVAGSAIDDRGVIYVSYNRGENIPEARGVYALNPTDGAILWDYQLAEGENWVRKTDYSPMIGEGGLVYFATPKAVYAIQGNGFGPANSAWPMRGQNAQRTNRAR